jgi:hypothetical protein
MESLGELIDAFVKLLGTRRVYGIQSDVINFVSLEVYTKYQDAVAAQARMGPGYRVVTFNVNI